MIGYLFARELLRDILELYDNKGEKVSYLKLSVFLTVFAYSLIMKISLNSSLGSCIRHSYFFKLVDLNE